VSYYVTVQISVVENIQFVIVMETQVGTMKNNQVGAKDKGSKLTVISIILLNARVTFIKSNKRNKTKLCKRVTPH
jgi:hypothetical protein